MHGYQTPLTNAMKQPYASVSQVVLVFKLNYQILLMTYILQTDYIYKR
uniref:Uncharacterized protein n=1 Tax=Arundo donax TaxID=35708 RepID=A0A0A9ALU8_ARUDO